eukprot:3072584-Pyramimonas_sp.AAC.1
MLLRRRAGVASEQQDVESTASGSEAVLLEATNNDGTHSSPEISWLESSSGELAWPHGHAPIARAL